MGDPVRVRGAHVPGAPNGYGVVRMQCLPVWQGAQMRLRPHVMTLHTQAPACRRQKRRQYALQGVLRLRRRDVPLAAVDHHVAQTILTPLMSDEFVLEATLDLAAEVEQFAGDDPQSVLRKLLCDPSASLHLPSTVQQPGRSLAGAPRIPLSLARALC